MGTSRSCEGVVEGGAATFFLFLIFAEAAEFMPPPLDDEAEAEGGDMIVERTTCVLFDKQRQIVELTAEWESKFRVVGSNSQPARRLHVRPSLSINNKHLDSNFTLGVSRRYFSIHSQY